MIWSLLFCNVSGCIGVCRAVLTSVGGVRYETSIPIYIYRQADCVHHAGPFPSTVFKCVVLSSHCFFWPLCRLVPCMVPSISFSRLLCLDLVTCPKYFSFRDFTWPSKALSYPTLMMRSTKKSMKVEFGRKQCTRHYIRRSHFWWIEAALGTRPAGGCVSYKLHGCIDISLYSVRP